jgi:hypothetical protein
MNFILKKILKALIHMHDLQLLRRKDAEAAVSGLWCHFAEKCVYYLRDLSVLRA